MKWSKRLFVLLFSGLLVCWSSSPFAVGLLSVAASGQQNNPTSRTSNTWSKVDTIRESTWQAIHVLDFMQTRQIARRPTLFSERNPVLGKYPSEGKVIAYFALGALTHGVISYYLPKPYRESFQYVTILFSAGVVATNFGVGLNFQF